MDYILEYISITYLIMFVSDELIQLWKEELTLTEIFMQFPQGLFILEAQ